MIQYFVRDRSKLYAKNQMHYENIFEEHQLTYLRNVTEIFVTQGSARQGFKTLWDILDSQSLFLIKPLHSVPL